MAVIDKQSQRLILGWNSYRLAEKVRQVFLFLLALQQIIINFAGAEQNSFYIFWFDVVIVDNFFKTGVFSEVLQRANTLGMPQQTFGSKNHQGDSERIFHLPPQHVEVLGRRAGHDDLEAGYVHEHRLQAL